MEGGGDDPSADKHGEGALAPRILGNEKAATFNYEGSNSQVVVGPTRECMRGRGGVLSVKCGE